MSHLDPYQRADDRGNRGREDPKDSGRARYGRHRARHCAAAPDPYAPSDPYAPTGSPTGYRPPENYRPPVDQRPPGDFQGMGALDIEEQRLPAGEPADRDEGRRGGRRRRRDRGGRGHSGVGDAGTRATGTARKTSSGRAGRNLPAAIGVGLTLGALVLGTLLLWKPAFLGVIAVAFAVAIWELIRAVRHSGAQPPLLPVLVGGIAMAGLAWYRGPDALSVGLLVTVLAAMIWRLADGPAGYQRDITAATLVAVYVPFLGGFAALLAAPDDGARRVLVTLAAVVLSDTGGYVAGVFLGRHPMAPSVSPKKSWEGLAGSLVATAAGGAILLPALFEAAPWWGAAFGLAISIASVLGDLAESMLKRDLGIKDMSALLPGHGGLMDRLDSILFALPTAYLMLSHLAG